MKSIHRWLFFLFILFLPTQLGYHWWPSWSLVLGRRIDYLSPTLFFTDVLLLLTFSFWLIESLLRRTFPIVHFFHVINVTALRWITPIAIFFAVNIWAAASRPVAVFTWIKVVECLFLVYYIVKTRPAYTTIVTLLSFGVFYSALLAIVQFFLQHSVGGPIWWLGERTFSSATPGIAQISLCLPFLSGCPLVLRPYATFPHPNVLGGFLAVTIPLIVSEFLSQRKPTGAAKQRVYRVAIVLGIIALALTFSRSAMVAFAVVLAGLYWPLHKQKSRFVPGALVVLPLALVSVALFIALSSGSLQGESVVVREQLVASAIQLFVRHPLTGIGFGNFLVLLPGVLPIRLVYFLQPVHSIYLLFLDEGGILGLVVAAWSFWLARGRLMVTTTHEVWVPAMSFVGLCLIGFVDHYPLTLQQGRLLFALLTALIFTAIKHSPTRSK